MLLPRPFSPSMSISVCLYVFVCLSLCLSVSVYPCLYLTFSVSLCLSLAGASIRLKPIMHIEYSPYFRNIYKCPSYFSSIYVFFLIYVYCFPYFDHDRPTFMYYALDVLNAPWLSLTAYDDDLEI